MGKTTKNQYVAEYQKPGKDDIQICIGAVTGGSFVFKAGSIEEETGLLSQYEAGHKGTVFVMDMLPKILEDKEASICLSDLHAFRIEDRDLIPSSYLNDIVFWRCFIRGMISCWSFQS